MILTPVCYKNCQKLIFSSPEWINNWTMKYWNLLMQWVGNRYVTFRIKIAGCITKCISITVRSLKALFVTLLCQTVCFMRHFFHLGIFWKDKFHSLQPYGIWVNYSKFYTAAWTHKGFRCIWKTNVWHVKCTNWHFWHLI
jgi:hypothetical protein